MQEVFNRYISYLEAERNVSPYTVRNYTGALIEFFDFVREKGIKSLNEIDKHTLRGYLAHLMEKDFAKASIACKLSAIRSFYHYLLREEMVSANPVATTTSPKLDRRLPSFLTVEEAKRLVESPDLSKPQGQRDRALLELLYASGLRVSELVNMNVEQINLDRPAARALSIYLSQGRPELLGGKKNNALFVNRYGGRLPPRSIQKILAKYARTIDKRVHPHMLRHTFATHLLDGGADLRVVQELLGHAQLSSTQIYTHVTQSQARKIYLSAHPMAQEKDNENK
jgi:integrase/recombinase XerC